MPLTNPHDKADRIRKMQEVRDAIQRKVQPVPSLKENERTRLLRYADDVLAYLEDDRVHYGCPLDDPCGFGEDEPDDIKSGDMVELLHDVWSLRRGQLFRAKIYSCSNGRWYCESLTGVSCLGWIDAADLKVAHPAPIPSPPQDLTTTT